MAKTDEATEIEAQERRAEYYANVKVLKAYQGEAEAAARIGVAVADDSVIKALAALIRLYEYSNSKVGQWDEIAAGKYDDPQTTE